MSTGGVIMLHRHPFVKAVAGPLRERCGVGSGDRLVLAVSGGADSISLVRALAALAERSHWALDLHVAHVNHGLREGSDEEERAVRTLSAEMGLPLHRRRIAPGEAAGNLEAAARRMRYDALAEIAAEAGADAVATAHHADDQLETMLMRLIRGTATEGLSAMAPRRRMRAAEGNGRSVALIRPMLWVDHAAARAFLEEIGQPWSEDPTNADRSRVRARLRAEVLPVLRDLKPDAAEKASRAADRLRESGRLMRHAARRVERREVEAAADGSAVLSREAARRMPRPMLWAVVRRRCLALGTGGDALRRRMIDPIVRSARDREGTTRTFDLPGGGGVRITAEAVRFIAVRASAVHRV